MLKRFFSFYFVLMFISACNAFITPSTKTDSSDNLPTSLIPTTATPIALATISSPETIAPPTQPVPVSTIESPTLPAPSAPSVFVNGTDISYFGMSFIIPSGLASGTQNDIIPQSNDPNVMYQVYPAYTRFILQDYPLQGKAFEP